MLAHVPWEAFHIYAVKHLRLPLRSMGHLEVCSFQVRSDVWMFGSPLQRAQGTHSPENSSAEILPLILVFVSLDHGDSAPICVVSVLIRK